MITVTKKAIDSKTTEYRYSGYGITPKSAATAQQERYAAYGYHTSLTTTEENIARGRDGAPDCITRCYLLVSEYPILEQQQDMGFTHCDGCGYDITDCSCPAQLDIAELI